MRYKFNISYDGTNYAGWQIQPNALTVQEVIEEKLSLIDRRPVSIVGCGRTDAGVHASDYYFHVDLNNNEQISTTDYRYKLNTMLPSSIAVKAVEEVNDEFHARFGAVRRSYTYRIHFKKDPYRNLYSYYCSFYSALNLEMFEKVAKILPNHTEFDTFLKTNSDVNTSKCQVYDSYWIYDESDHSMTFHITADRYLRGMIRLIVGACINAARDKLTICQIEDALSNKRRLDPNWSVPPQGLFLSKVEY